ncbi:MAG TPA: acyl-CoA dehydrogenase [Patescibacteria group bacterium]|nr:acyl-CoA dehydrogenase [Patescibacteria group bacterium]
MMTPTGADELLAAWARDIAQLAAEAAGSETRPGDTEAEDAAARRALGAVAELLPQVVPDATGRVSARNLCIIREELAYASGLSDTMFVMQGLGSSMIAAAGSGALQTRYLPAVARGEIVAAIALTEPDAGSDLAGIVTQAALAGDHYRIDGVKTFISNAGIADFYTLLARTGGKDSGRRGISAFVVDARTPGLRVKERLSLSAPHPIGTLELSDCVVPVDHRLGAEGDGYDLALRTLDRFRPTVGAAALGLARRALDESVGRARSRKQFGRRLAEFQAIRFKIADMAMWLEAGRLLVMRAASLIDDGPDDGKGSRRASAMAKLYATEAAQRIVDEAVQIHGGLGVTRGQVVERLYREVRALRIYEGTSEIQRSIIAHSLLKESA